MSPERRSVVKRSGAVARQVVATGNATEMQILIGPDDGAANFTMRRFLMGEGGGMPPHTNEVEHEQFVLSGRARIGVGDEVLEVQPGDALYIPARVPHFYEVLEAPFEFLCVVPNLADTVSFMGDQR